MIIEHATLQTDPARREEFEAGFAAGRTALASAPGCRSVELIRSVDVPGAYLLRVGWDNISDHLEVFPSTPQAEQFAAAVAHFFTEAPTVIHYEADSL